MGSRSGKNKQPQFDPNFGPYEDPFYPEPPGYPPYVPGYPPYGSFEQDPYGMYGYGGGYTNTFESYGPPPYGGRFGRGLGPPGMSPWNYGNYYMGNTTMQMMPYMQRKVAKFAQRQAMGSMGSMGGFGGFPSMPSMPMMPMMPVMPMMPMMAAATPLPMACNPIVQNMYPMAPMNYQYPSNVGMVMNMPYGLPNPLLAPSTFGGFFPQSFSSGMSCCCCFCMPAPAPPPVCYYPRPVSVPQPVPVPYPAPVPIPNIQQVPVPRPVTVVAPPIMAGSTPGCPIPAGAPLAASFGGLSRPGFGQQLVMHSKDTSTVDSLLTSTRSEKSKTESSADSARRARARKLAASLSNLGLDNTIPRKSSKHRHNHHRSKRNSDFIQTHRAITCPSDVCTKN